MANAFPHGTVHEAGEDLQAALRSDPKVFGLWESLTPLGRNEFICWVDDAKQPTTRQRRIARACDELLEGKKRPCCWAGCIHRTDKAPSRWQQAVLIDSARKERLTGRLAAKGRFVPLPSEKPPVQFPPETDLIDLPDGQRLISTRTR